MSGWKDCTSRADSEPLSYAAKPIMHDIYGKLPPYVTESFIVKFNPCMNHESKEYYCAQRHQSNFATLHCINLKSLSFCLLHLANYSSILIYWAKCNNQPEVKKSPSNPCF